MKHDSHSRVYKGRLIPVMRGGDPIADPLFPDLPQDADELRSYIDSLELDELTTFIDATRETVEAVAASYSEYLVEGVRNIAELRAELEAGVAAIKEAREAVKAYEVEEPEAEVDETAEVDAIASLAADLDEADEPEEPEAVEPETEEPVVAAAAVVAPAPTPARRPSRPARSRASVPAESPQTRVSLTAAAGASDLPLGFEFPSEIEIADAMIRRRGHFGLIPEGLAGEKMPIARASWSHLYPSERVLGGDDLANEALIAAATDIKVMRAEFDRRRRDPVGASGGLCAPVTPYYQLQMVSTADRPVRAALASFNADRGGIRYAQPATLAEVQASDATGIRTADEDGAGGSTAAKTCAVVTCPDFQESDVDIIYHCLQFGNLGARTFPERVAQWNNLTLAAHARLAESNLLTGIDAFSSQVTAGALGLGATAALLGQILAAANGMRNRHRMATDAILRLMLPWWAVDMLVSDVIRSQFQRFDTDQARITALLRSFDIEPSFYIDGANGRAQTFDVQPDGALLSFPENVVWYLYPEGSFLYLDGGTLELGLVRDSVLNSSNDFQIFGETFENVAYVGVEALAVESPLCDSGTVSLPAQVTCPIDYELAS